MENLDRISRAHLFEAFDLLRELVSLDINVITLSDRMVYTASSFRDPSTAVIATMAFTRAHGESKRKSELIGKQIEAKRNSWQPGEIIFSHAPSWVFKGDHGWAVDLARARSIRWVFDQYAQGFGSKHIARQANEDLERWPVPKKAETWHNNLPFKLINDRRVLGELRLQKLNDDGERVNLDKVLKDYYPAIITEQEFYNAQATKARRADRGPTRDGEYRNIFQGMLRCGHCGGTLSRKGKTGGRNKKGYFQFVCSCRDRGAKSCPTWNGEELEELLVQTALVHVAKEGAAASRTRESYEALEAAREQLKAASAQKNNLVKALALGGDDQPHSIVAMVRQLEVAERDLNRRIGNLEALLAGDKLDEWQFHQAHKLIEDALDAVRSPGLDKAPDRERWHQSLLRHVEKISVFHPTHAEMLMRGNPRAVVLDFTEKAAVGALVGRMDAKVAAGGLRAPARS